MKLHRSKQLIPAPKDAVRRYLVVSPTQLAVDASGNYKGGKNVSVEVWMQKGESKEPTQEGIGEFQVEVYKDGSSSIHLLQKVVSFSFEAAKGAVSYEIRLRVAKAYVHAVTIAVTEDGKDGLDAQFAPNSSPTTAQIHSTFQAGDIFMRTKKSTETFSGNVDNAHPWVRITGENAKETDYSFNISKNQTSTNASTAPADCYYTNWQDTPPATTSSYPYLWMRVQKKDKDGNVTSTSYARVTGEQGPQGPGFTGTTWYYLATTMATGVTRSTPGWGTSYQKATKDLPYVWRYGATLKTTGAYDYTDCELIFSYSAGANSNLLEQTNFSSMQALDKWNARNRITPISGVTVASENYATITTGTQAHNAYYDKTVKTNSQIQYKDILQQTLWATDGSIRKLEPGTWYTLSFWLKGSGCSTFIYPSVFDNTSVCYIDGVLKNANALGADAYIAWAAGSSWVQHTFTFKTKGTFGNSDQRLLFRLYPKSSAATTNEMYLCMPKLEVGMQATGYLSSEDTLHNGQPRRRRWAENTEYFAGGVDEKYDDVVLVGDTGFYHCIKSHISTADNRPGTGSNWQSYWTAAKSGQYEMLSTDLFFATKAYVDNLIATLIQTGYEGTPHIEAEGSEFKIFGKGQYPAIFLAVNSDNKAVLRFQNENTGEFLYDLGPDGIMKEFSEVADSWSEIKLKKLANATRISEILNVADAACTSYYRFTEGYKKIGSGTSATKEYHVSGTSSPSSKNTQYFTSKNYNGTTIADGWYVKPNKGNYLATENQYEQVVTDSGMIGFAQIYTVTIYQFSGGKMVASVPVYFKNTDSQYASKSVGCDKNGNELSTSTYPYLYSYWQQNNITL